MSSELLCQDARQCPRNILGEDGQFVPLCSEDQNWDLVSTPIRRMLRDVQNVRKLKCLKKRLASHLAITRVRKQLEKTASEPSGNYTRTQTAYKNAQQTVWPLHVRQKQRCSNGLVMCWCCFGDVLMFFF